MHIVIVEDEPIVAQRIERLTRELLKDKLTNLKWFNTVDAALDYLAVKPIDLLMLDLNLSGRDGFEILKMAVAGSFQTIIISAYAEQAITAFEYGVLDFVNKPFSKQRLEKSFDRYLNTERQSTNKTKFLAIKKRNILELVNIDDIRYIQGSNIYSEVVLNDGETYLHDKTLGKLMIVLPPVFQRVHKSYLVKMSEVKRMISHKGSKYELELNNGEVLPVGRTFYKTVQQYFV